MNKVSEDTFISQTDTGVGKVQESRTPMAVSFLGGKKVSVLFRALCIN